MRSLKNNVFKNLLSSLFVLSIAFLANAENEIDITTEVDTGFQSVDDGTELLYDKFDENESKKESQRQVKKKLSPKFKDEDFNKISDLVRLSPFEDIAVIQRRFLPKTERLEFSASGMISTNNAFFNNFGASLKLGYYFNETWGLEGSYFFLDNSDRDVTKNLEDKQRISTKSLVVPKSFYGLALKWSPIYGKMALFDEKIIPFDLYFAPGIGITETGTGDQEFTINLGTGQIFAVSKSLAFRWDFNWNFYSATVTQEGGGKVTQNSNDLFIALGISYFFPEATYR